MRQGKEDVTELAMNSHTNASLVCFLKSEQTEGLCKSNVWSVEAAVVRLTERRAEDPGGLSVFRRRLGIVVLRLATPRREIN